MTGAAVEWSAEAELALMALPPSVADAIFAAVLRHASTGKGFVRVMNDGSEENRLEGRRWSVVFVRLGTTLQILRVVTR